ncbi:Integral membrane protein [Apiospora saccharicola]|uniref:Integral membrane protein n=1 Tax=Apiospora saccharicola TaxID=335842 RepID=A0ABR1TMM4_9PEZI
MALGHDHSSNHIPEGKTISDDPIDTTLWVHIFIQMVAWGVIFPVGMVLGIVKSRWHVPVQALGGVLAILGYFLGHMHGGREFGSNIHSVFATPLMFMLLGQGVMGIYLKLHLEKGFHGKMRRWVKLGHSILGKAMPVLAWTQMVFGGIATLGFCHGDHLGQCLAHYIMGSSFIAYGILSVLVLLVGQVWLRRTGRSQEFFDSAMIASWGFVNTLTEHRWGGPWVENDWQHTTMGVIWWCAGLVGIWLSKDRTGRPQRNFIPGFVLLITGWAMSSHPQHMMTSAQTHKLFGYTLMAAGLSRIIEISFVATDGVPEDGSPVRNFQFISVFLLYASGTLFMGATEEQMDLIENSGMDHVAYILIMYSIAFLIFLFSMMLINLYDQNANPAAPTKHLGNGRLGAGSHVPVRDAQEFELEGLMSDDEDAEGNRLLRDEDLPLDSPSTVGKNSDKVAN